MAGIDIGLGENLVPGIFIKQLFAQGQSTANAGARAAVYVMPKTSAGTWQVNQPVLVKDEASAIAGAGIGSPLHRALKAHFNASKKGKVYACPYDGTSGVGATAADGAITFSGTATASGQVLVMGANETFVIGYSTGTTADALGDIVEARLNGAEFLPFTSANSSGAVTLTARIAGASQNGVIRFRAKVLSGAGITVAVTGETLGTGTGTAAAEGAVTEQTNFQSALDALAQRYYFIGHSLCTTAALTSVKNKLVADTDPLVGKRQVSVGAYVGAGSEAQALSVAKNNERMMIACQPYSEVTPEELVGNVIGVRQFKENVSARAGFSGFRGDSEVNWNIPAVYDQTNWIDNSDAQDMLTDGVTPIMSDENGSYIVKAVTTRSKNAAGAVNDKRALENHRISTSDFYADTISLRNNTLYAGQDYALAPDTLNRDGSVDMRAIKPKTVTPRIWKGLPLRIIDEFDSAGFLKNVQGTKDSVEVQISNESGMRLESAVNLDVVDLFEQTSVLISEVSAG